MPHFIDQKNGRRLNLQSIVQPSAPGKFGNCPSFNGGTDVALNCPDGGISAFGVGAFCIELWVKQASVSAVWRAMIVSSNYNGAGSFFLGSNGSTLYWYEGSTARITAAGAITVSEWMHIALSRDGSGNTKLFVNGTQVGSTYVSTYNFTAIGLLVGREPLNYPFYGEIDELRVTIGDPRYTANFTAPNAPFDNTDPLWANVALLFHFDTVETVVSGADITNAIDLTNFYYATPQPFTTPRRLAGTVKENGVAVGAGKRVVAQTRGTLQYIGSTVTKADGSFEMAMLADRTGNPEKLFVVAFDDDGVNPNYNAVIADQVEQEV